MVNAQIHFWVKFQGHFFTFSVNHINRINLENILLVLSSPSEGGSTVWPFLGVSVNLEKVTLPHHS